MKRCYYLLIFISQFVVCQSWSPLTSISQNLNGQRFDDVFFLDENVGWAANGYYAAVYKTIDGGQNWIEQTNNSQLGSAHYFRNIEFLNSDIGFLGTLNNKFYKTIDGGTTWNLVSNITPNPVAICGIDCVGTSTIYGCGAYFSPAYVIKSTDSGVTWQYIDMSAYATALVEVLFLNATTGFVSGKNASGAVILKTTDGGTSWTPIYNGTIPGEFVWKLEVLPSNTNVIFGSIESVAPNFGKLLKSVDSGLNWITKNFPADDDVQAVGFITESHGWMGGHDSGFYETFDSGDTWTNTNVGSNLNRIFIVNSNLAYACGTTIYKMTNVLNTNEFQETPRMPLDVRVSPNPIKDKLNIEIDFRGNDHLVLELYSVDGKLIKQLKLDLINETGTQRYSFDFPYSNGIYILNLHTNTGRQSIKITK